jgi:hypothetical protein
VCDLDHINVVKIDDIQGHRGKYMLLYTHFKAEPILLVCHRLNEVQRIHLPYNISRTHLIGSSFSVAEST